jgi:hypothetical protein
MNNYKYDKSEILKMKKVADMIIQMRSHILSKYQAEEFVDLLDELNILKKKNLLI